MKFTLKDRPIQTYQDPVVTVDLWLHREDGMLIQPENDKGEKRMGPRLNTIGSGSTYEQALANAYREMIHELSRSVGEVTLR